MEGHIVIFSETELREIHRLMTTIANNVNQIAVRANSTGKVYDEDIAEIKEEINQIWQPLRYFQSQLLSENSKPVLKPRSVKISNDTYVKYFRNGTKPKEIAETIEKALEFYFKNNT